MKKTIVFDFDGVIHQGYIGWKDGSIYGTINYELLDYIKELLKNYRVVISSTRSAKQIVDHMNSLDTGLKFEVFEKTKEVPFWNKDGAVGVIGNKPIGILYVDDRAYKYVNDISNKKDAAMFNIAMIEQALKEGD